MVPNHALIMLGLLYGEDDFQKTLMITNTCGWDTDCNSGNIGCLMGIKNGLAGIDCGPDWRSPVADRLFLPTADGGRCVTDAVTESFRIVNTGRVLASLPPIAPKQGARYHFELPGSVQGWQAVEAPHSRGVLRIENVTGHSQLGEHSLALHYTGLAPGRFGRAATSVFVPPEAMNMPGYPLFASPNLYPGQVVHCAVSADKDNDKAVSCQLYAAYYGEKDGLVSSYGPQVILKPEAQQVLTWKAEAPTGAPLALIGLELTGPETCNGSVYLDYLTWDGAPDVIFEPPVWEGLAWRNAWVNGVDHFGSWGEPFRLIQDEGTGLVIQGTRQWNDYRVSADVTPHMAAAAGLAGRVQGMRRYYAIQLVHPGKLQLVKALDGIAVLAEIDFPWQYGEIHQLALAFQGQLIRAWVDEQLIFTITDSERPLDGGAVGLLCMEGRTATWQVVVKPV